MKPTRYIYIAAALLSYSNAFAQDKKIDTVEFNVISKYRPVITDAVKLNNNPAIADTVKPARKAEYNNLLNTQYATSYTPDALEAMRMKGEPLDKLYHSYLNAGFGNYNTLYGEYFFNCLRSRDYDYGIHLNHLSSDATIKNYGYAAYGYNDVNLYGDAYLKHHILYAQADYDNHIVHDYGYNIQENSITNNTTRENYNYFGGAIGYKSNLKDSTGISHDIKVTGYNFSDVFKAKENNLGADMHFFTFYDKQRIDIIAFAKYYSDVTRKDTMHTWNMMFNPYFSAAGKHWDARLGAKIFYDASSFYYYPDFTARYRIAGDAALIYAGIDGKHDVNSYKTLSDENPFMIDTARLHPTNTVYHFFVGFAGTIASNLSFDINGSQSEIDNMALFATDTLETLRNRFSVIYDNVRVINGHGELTYIMKDNLKLTLMGDYNIYTPSQQAYVWYHPNLQIGLTGQYIYKNCTFKATFLYIGTQYGPIPAVGIPAPGTSPVWLAQKIAGYPDLNLGFDYHYNRLLTAFLNINNIANVTKERWLNYPTQGFNAMLGIRLAF